MSYSTELITRIKQKYFQTSGEVIPDDTAIEYLESLSSIFITFSIAEHPSKAESEMQGAKHLA